MKKRLFLFLMAIIFGFGRNMAQAPSTIDKITDKIVLGMPGITNDQLAGIQADLVNHPQILSAKFVYNDHNCLLITLDLSGTEFTQFYNLLKIFDPFYDTTKSYIKPYYVYDEIDGKLKGLTYNQLK